MANKIVRSKTVQCKVSEDEFNKIDGVADEIGLSVSSYARMVCLRSKIDTINTDPKQFIDILRIGGGLNKDVQRDKIVQCRVSDEEYKEIVERANSIALDIISYLRMVCLLSKLDIFISPENIEKF